MSHLGFRVQGRAPGHTSFLPKDLAHDDFELRSVAIEHAQRLESMGWRDVTCSEVRTRVVQGEWDHAGPLEFIPIEWQLYVIGA